MTERSRIVAIVVALLVLTPAPARADAKTEAQVHVDKAAKLHDAQQFLEALDELAIAYSLDPKPELLYAMGQVHVKLAGCGEAIAFYTRFLATKPAEGPAGEAQEAIATCEKSKQPRLDVHAEAKRRIANATTFHQAGQYGAARGELVVAYALDPSPDLLFALAQVQVKLDSCERAIPYYERFLSTNPQPGPAAEASEAIDVCKKRAAEPGKPLEPPRVVAPVAGEAPPWYTDRLGLALVGGGVALAVVGIVEYRAALGDLDAADAATTYSAHADLVDSAHSKRTLAAVFAVGGVALTGAGVARFVLHDRRTESRGVAIVPGLHGGVIAWRGQF